MAEAPNKAEISVDQLGKPEVERLLQFFRQIVEKNFIKGEASSYDICEKILFNRELCDVFLSFVLSHIRSDTCEFDFYTDLVEDSVELKADRVAFAERKVFFEESGFTEFFRNERNIKYHSNDCPLFCVDILRVNDIDCPIDYFDWDHDSCCSSNSFAVYWKVDQDFYKWLEDNPELSDGLNVEEFKNSANKSKLLTQNQFKDYLKDDVGVRMIEAYKAYVASRKTTPKKD